MLILSFEINQMLCFISLVFYFVFTPCFISVLIFIICFICWSLAYFCRLQIIYDIIGYHVSFFLMFFTLNTPVILSDSSCKTWDICNSIYICLNIHCKSSSASCLTQCSRVYCWVSIHFFTYILLTLTKFIFIRTEKYWEQTWFSQKMSYFRFSNNLSCCWMNGKFCMCLLD